MEQSKINAIYYIRSMVSSWLDNSEFIDEEEIKMLFYSYVVTVQLLMQITNTTEEMAVKIIKNKYSKVYPPLKKATIMEAFKFANGEMKKWWSLLGVKIVWVDRLYDKVIKQFILTAVVSSYMLGYTFNELFALAESYKPTKKMQKVLIKKKEIKREENLQLKNNTLRQKNYDDIDSEFKSKKSINYQALSESIKNDCTLIINNLKNNKIDSSDAMKKIKTLSDYLISKLNKGEK